MTQLMTLEALRGERGRKQGLCKTGRILEALAPEDHATISEALAGLEEEFPSATIAGVLSDNGFVIGSDSIREHRRQTCACKKPL
jgi:hypothetical protein